jgi:hypothetical protein
MGLHLPAQAAVDRSAVLRPATGPLDVFNTKGVLVKVLDAPLGGDYGLLPADPARVVPAVDRRWLWPH